MEVVKRKLFCKNSICLHQPVHQIHLSRITCSEYIKNVILCSLFVFHFYFCGILASGWMTRVDKVYIIHKAICWCSFLNRLIFSFVGGTIKRLKRTVNKNVNKKWYNQNRKIDIFMNFENYFLVWFCICWTYACTCTCFQNHNNLYYTWVK